VSDTFPPGKMVSDTIFPFLAEASFLTPRPARKWCLTPFFPSTSYNDAHEQAKDRHAGVGAPRPKRLEPQESFHRLDGRRPHGAGPPRGARCGPHATRGGPHVRHRVHVR